MKSIIVWYNPNKDVYYYKVSSGTYAKYFVGFRNQYNHEIVLIIDSVFYRKPQKLSMKKRVLRKAISFLQNRLNQ